MSEMNLLTFRSTPLLDAKVGGGKKGGLMREAMPSAVFVGSPFGTWMMHIDMRKMQPKEHVEPKRMRAFLEIRSWAMVERRHHQCRLSRCGGKFVIDYRVRSPVFNQHTSLLIGSSAMHVAPFYQHPVWLLRMDQESVRRTSPWPENHSRLQWKNLTKFAALRICCKKISKFEMETPHALRESGY